MGHSFTSYMSQSSIEFLAELDKSGPDIFLNHLPAYGYGDNEVAEWLTKPFGEIVYGAYLVVKSFYNNASRTVNPPWLDMAGVSQGFFSYGFWDRSWPNSVKQQLLYHSQTIWQNIGTESTLRLVSRIFGMELNLWLGGAPFTTEFGETGSRLDIDPLPLGGGDYGFLTLPLQVERGSKDWVAADRILYYFTPATYDITTTYDQFYCDYSAAGEPVLS